MPVRLQWGYQLYLQWCKSVGNYLRLYQNYREGNRNFEGVGGCTPPNTFKIPNIHTKNGRALLLQRHRLQSTQEITFVYGLFIMR